MKRHDTDVASLVLGLPGLEIAAPVLLVSVGLAGLVASLGRIRRDRDGVR
jgi:hypothetical protein